MKMNHMRFDNLIISFRGFPYHLLSFDLIFKEIQWSYCDYWFELLTENSSLSSNEYGSSSDITDTDDLKLTVNT